MPQRRHPVALSFSALFALGQDGLLQSLPKFIRKLIDDVFPVDLDRFAGSVERDDAMLASAQMLFELGPHWNGYVVVNQVVQLRQKL